jgi:sirohydrochlorin ferrochelatase
MELPAALNRARARHPQTEFAVTRHLGMGREIFTVLQGQLERLMKQLAVPDPRSTGVILLGRGSSDAGANGELAKMARWIFEANEHELVDLAFTGVTWPRLETAVQRQVKLGMMQVCIVPVYLFTGVLIERIKAQVERLQGNTRRSPSRSARTSASTRGFSSCSTARWGAKACPKAECSNATAANIANSPRTNTCTTTATPPPAATRRCPR